MKAAISYQVALIAAALLLLAALPGPSRAGEREGCLSCHASHEQALDVRFEDGSSLVAYVDKEKFLASIHSSIDCTGCHTEFSSSEHPERKFKNVRAYRLKMVRICRRCHSESQISKAPVHSDLLSSQSEGKAPLCTECHSAHAVDTAKDGRSAKSEARYCMGCHGHDIASTFMDGSSFKLSVDLQSIMGSAHHNISCSDCHFGFSSSDHPKRQFKDARQYTLASSEVCKRCHFDKYIKVSESIHYDLLSQGNTSAPGCTDCHGTHNIQSMRTNRLARVEKCKDCHSDIFGAYKRSVHGAALINEHNMNVPICTDCHVSHRIRNPHDQEFHNSIPDTCSTCHADKKVMNLYGLSTDVVKTYLSDFHGMTLEMYKKQAGADKFMPERAIAVCTDCHGVHDIMPTSGPDSSVVKGNLVKRCRACHPDATEDFPAAWLSHYKPSLAHSPLVFLVDMSYKVLMPLMVAGLLLQVLLHIWRFLVNR